MDPEITESPIFEFDLKKPEFSYMLGFFQADGTMYLHKDKADTGKLGIELNAKDIDILKKIQKLIPFHSTLTPRIRNTNFGDDVNSATLSIYAKEFRHSVIDAGLLYGEKHLRISPPTKEYREIDYYRGLIDGDGSVGVTKKPPIRPYISLNTSSDAIAQGFIGLIRKSTGRSKKSTRNVRDQTYNIVVFDEDCQKLVNILYYDNCLAMDRKYQAAKNLQNWIRTKPKRNFKFMRWLEAEDQFIQNHTVEEAAKKLERTEQSIKMRLWRLKKGK